MLKHGVARGGFKTELEALCAAESVFSPVPADMSRYESGATPRDNAMPLFVRIPGRGEPCPVSDFTKTKMNQLLADVGEPISSLSISLAGIGTTGGGKRGTRLISTYSLLKYQLQPGRLPFPTVEQLRSQLARHPVDVAIREGAKSTRKMEKSGLAPVGELQVILTPHSPSDESWMDAETLAAIEEHLGSGEVD
ncbi:hypothetical protein llg_43170 [Luteolibacter sp. LG18]|nr:hypothetical protein llg_22790 [Luteolibacter sp. LG18]BCU79602.1 hypothetical protein llg_43170 [Luteolibacter sp. LG18]